MVEVDEQRVADRTTLLEGELSPCALGLYENRQEETTKAVSSSVIVSDIAAAKAASISNSR